MCLGANLPVDRADAELCDEPENKTCKQCGCTEHDCSDCIERTGRPCYWVGEVCSACVEAVTEEEMKAETMILSKKEYVDKNGALLGHCGYWFWCPGCEQAHRYAVGTGEGPRWTFNGDMDKPTFTPSLGLNMSRPESRCHLFVTDGRIQFLPDSYHKLAGQTVDMVPVPEWLR